MQGTRYDRSRDGGPAGPLQVALLVPCHNEAATVAAVVAAFRASLPAADCHVFDNRSDDGTGAIAQAAGAQVHAVALRGKGNVIRRAFADIEADVYVMVDGDATYDAAAAPMLVQRLLDQGLDMVVGARVDQGPAAYRAGHRFGNRLLTRCVGLLFGDSFDDMLSGYRVFSRRYVKSFPAHAAGFEIETELAVHALQLRMPVAELPTAYGARPEGSASKLNTYRDGARILATILRLFKAERPLLFFSLGAGASLLLSVLLAIPLFVTYIETGLVPRFPTAILCSALVLLSAVLLACGLILDTVTRGRIEAKRLAYLAIPATHGALPARGEAEQGAVAVPAGEGVR
ncbi:glycosyltransferase family 2 protein [Pseudoxanthomonas kaohsiungensis]|uniref:Glycosyltransferase family 2 protein n=1 Tax=Pseudoxanthomonas kaohsiungensis TaxID=283923 RepID=A0ABW3M218_9GAMM|nr:glycosyltransferase family 2 protein [Pseudoxanthomonas kaohsiungensis]KAF1702716.1 glycosyl transferase [Pseudoxanthomonas kaohsiungensis]